MNKGKKLKSIDTPVYNYWSALYKSFYSKSLYVDVGKRWHGFGLLYLLLAITLFSIPLSMKVSSNLARSFEEQLIDPLSQLPIIYMQNGELNFDQPMPFLIKNKKDQVISIIDTTGTVNEINAAYPYLNILLKKDSIVLKIPTPQILKQDDQQINPGVPIVQFFDKETNLVFDGKKLVNDRSITALKYFSELMIFPMLIGIIFSVFLVVLPVIALLGQVFSSVFFSFKLSYLTSSRLLIVASTPMLLILIAAIAFNIVFVGMGLILFGLLLLYYSFALFALRAESQKLVVA